MLNFFFQSSEHLCWFLVIWGIISFGIVNFLFIIGIFIQDVYITFRFPLLWWVISILIASSYKTIICNFYQIGKDCDKNGYRLFQNGKNGHICNKKTKGLLLVSNEKMELCLYMMTKLVFLNFLGGHRKVGEKTLWQGYSYPSMSHLPHKNEPTSSPARPCWSSTF